MLFYFLTESNGVGRTGAFCVIYAGINEIDLGNGIIQINEMIGRMRRQRRSMVQYKEQLKFCYDTVLYYAQDMLRRRKYFMPTFVVSSAPLERDVESWPSF